MKDTEPGALEGEALGAFMRALLLDLEALDRMLGSGALEVAPARIGAEQELFFVDGDGRPASVVEEVLARLSGGPFVAELGRFNLEINVEPIPLGKSCLSQLEAALQAELARARAAAAEVGTEVALCGILPTLLESDLVPANMTDRPRYHELDRALKRQRGATTEVRIRGTDELAIRCDSVLIEAANASFQVHRQVPPGAFARYYNVAQVALAPTLAIAVNSPLLFRRRLWPETRIALFEQAVDTRSSALPLREKPSRVGFGRAWVRESVLELFREDVARFKALIGCPPEEDPRAVLDRGGVPRLGALAAFNGTVWRWNRPCYGITDGRPHLRIENRVLPAGPSVVDQVANAAFWLGLVEAMAAEPGCVSTRFRFEDARANFHAAATGGLAAQLVWSKGRVYPARELVCMHLLPRARDGLALLGIEPVDIERYLGVIEERAISGRTGADWMLESRERMPAGRSGERMRALVRAMVAHQRTGTPVHAWPLAELSPRGAAARARETVEQLMSTDVVSVLEDEPLELVASLMSWEGARHVVVEDHDHRLTGVIDHADLLRHLAAPAAMAGDGARAGKVARDAMQRDVPTVAPGTSVLEALALLRQGHLGCLPVLQDGRLVGVLGEGDFLDLARDLLALADERPAASRTGALARAWARHGIVDLTGDEPGPLVVVTSGLHGNEPFGVAAARRVAAALAGSFRTGLRGRFVALVGNVGALERDQRHVARDLNRMWTPGDLARARAPEAGPRDAEDRELAELVALLDDLAPAPGVPVYLVDCHTASSPSVPFLVPLGGAEDLAFAGAIGIPVVAGLADRVDGTLLHYARARRWAAFGVEGGRHDDRGAVAHAAAVVALALARAGALTLDRARELEPGIAALHAVESGLPSRIDVFHRHAVESSDGFAMRPGYVNFQRIVRGEILANDVRGPITAIADGRILLPLYQGKGTDGFFIGRESASSDAPSISTSGA